MNKDYDIRPFPNVGNNVFYREFHIGNMLPMGGSTEGYANNLIKKDILDNDDEFDIDDIFEESKNTNSNNRKKVLSKTIKVLEENGRKPKITEKDKTKWINCELKDFGGKLCIAGLGYGDLQKVCTEVNKIIKPYGGKITPDNYGTAFLSIKESTKLLKEREEDKMINTSNIVTEMFSEFFGYDSIVESSKGGDPEVPDKIEPIVQALEAKGYKVKYASPGYTNTRFDNDRDNDGVINNKLVSTGRIIFSRDYKFNNTPKGWEWKVLKNNSKALYVKPFTYNDKYGTEKEAFQKWQKDYLDNITDWVTKLPQCGMTDDTKNEIDENFK